MTIWRYKEKAATHTLVKLYREDHGEGEFLGDLSEEAVKALIAELKPKMGVEQAFAQLSYFGFVPLLDIQKGAK